MGMVEKPKQETRDLPSIEEISGSSGRERSVSTDTILSAVASEHRRAILTALANAPEETLEYEALVTRVADQVRDDGPKQVSDGHRQRVRIALHHTHLPKLEEARMVDYEAEAGDVRFDGGTLEQKILTLVEQHETQSD